jgi:N-methylhydantoinase B
VIRDYRVLTDNVMLDIANDSQVSPPCGLFEGKEGSTPRVIEFEGTDKENVTVERVYFHGPFHTGDRLRCHSSGGGGWGDPLERDHELAMRDVRLEYVSKEEGRQVYGVVIDEDGEVDREATRAVRSERQGMR